MYSERSLYCSGKEKFKDLSTATELDPSLTYPYKYRAIALVEEDKVGAAIAEINKILGFKVTTDCLELRAWFSLILNDYERALQDVRANMTLDPGYMIFHGRFPGDQMIEMLKEYVHQWDIADCWMQLYDRWSAVDDIGSLAVVHQMLAKEPNNSSLRFRQSLLLSGLIESDLRARSDWLTVGNLSLNLTSFTTESASIFGNQLIKTIQSLLPFSRALPLTIEYLNTETLQPRKNNQTGRLVFRALQLAPGTHLTVDETPLQAGVLNSNGVENVRLLKHLMDWQKVEYDFEYYKLEMDADVQMLIMSEGKSNILPADLVLPFRPTTVTCNVTASAEELQAWRWYLVTLRSLPYSNGPEMLQLNYCRAVCENVVRGTVASCETHPARRRWVSRLLLRLLFRRLE